MPSIFMTLFAFLLSFSRLSYHQRIVESVPENFAPLLPKKPGPVNKFKMENACEYIVLITYIKHINVDLYITVLWTGQVVLGKSLLKVYLCSCVSIYPNILFINKANHFQSIRHFKTLLNLSISFETKVAKT